MALSLDTNRSGQAYAFTAFSPITPGEEDALRERLLAFTPETSPLAALPGTHFGRWVIVTDFVHDAKQPRPDPLPCPHLLFTSNFDGGRDDYLRRLCALPAAQEIWARCDGAPAPGAPAELAAYLRRGQIRTGFFVAAYGAATVPRVRAALARREQLIALAIDAQAMTPGELRRAVAERF